MDIETIMDLWKPHANNAKAGVEWWNGNAEKFSSMDLPTADNSIGMRIIEREGMVKKDCSVLDIGCGCGRFSFALDSVGADVTGTDFSPKMIERAENQQVQSGSQVNFSVDNWHTLSLKEKDWEAKFDLVLANMTPAVVSAETFLKLSDASRNWVLMVKPTRRTNLILDELNKLLGADQDTKALDETVAYAFDLLWFQGFCPRLEYENQVWESNLPLDKAVEEYTLRISSMHELSEGGRTIIREYLQNISDREGSVRETTNTTVVAIYWQVR